MEEFEIITPAERPAAHLAEQEYEFVKPLTETSEYEFATPSPKPTTPMAAVEEVGRLGREVPAGLVSDFSNMLRAGRVATGIQIPGLIPATEKVAETLTPKGPSPIPGFGPIEEAVHGTAAMIPSYGAGAVPGTLFGGPAVGHVAGTTTMGLVSTLSTYDRFMENIRNILEAQGATPEQVQEGLGLTKKYGIWSGLSAGGSLAFMVGLTRAAAKIDVAGLNKAVGQFATQYLKTTPPFIAGSEVGIIGEHGAEAAAYDVLKDQFPDLQLPDRKGLWEQMMSGAESGAAMSAILMFLFRATGGRRPTKPEDIKAPAPVSAKTKALIDKYNIGASTAQPETERIVTVPEAAAIDQAISSLDTGIKERQTKRARKTSKKTAETIATVIAPEKEAVPTPPTPSEVIAPSMYADIAAPAQRAARDLGIPVTSLTTDQLIEKTGIDLEKAKASILAAGRLEVGQAEPVAETVPSPAPTPEEAKPVSAPKTIEEQTVAAGPTPVLKLKDGAIVSGRWGQQHFEIADEKSISYEDVAERGFINSRGEYTNPGNLKGIEKEKVGPPPKATEAGAVDAATEVIPPDKSVEKINIDKAGQAELVKKIKANPDLEKFIVNMTHPRGEGYTPDELLAAEGVPELLQDAGIPSAQQLAAIKAVGLSKGYWTAEDLALDRFGAGLDIDGAISAEFERLINAGRATELEGLGMTDEQVDTALMKEATSTVEAKLQDLAGDQTMSDKIESSESQALADEELANTEIKIATTIAIEESAKVTPAVETATYVTKREALAARNSLENSKDYKITGSKGKWAVERKETAPKISEQADLEKTVTEHSLFMSRSQTDLSTNVIKKIGKIPDRLDNPQGYLDAMKTAISNAYHNKDSVGEIWVPLKSLMTDLREQAHRFNLEQRSAKELLEYAGSIADYAAKVAEAVSGGKRYGVPSTSAYKQAMLEYGTILDKVQREINLEGSQGGFLRGDRLIEIALKSPAIGRYHRYVLETFLENERIRNKLKSMKVKIDKKSLMGVSYYDPKDSSLHFDPVSSKTCSIGSTIVHEDWHHITDNTLSTSPAWAAEISGLRTAAIATLPEADRLLVMSAKSTDFHAIPGRARLMPQHFQNPDLYNVYYGLVDKFEFVAMVADSHEMIEFLDAIPPTEPMRNVVRPSLYKQIWRGIQKHIFGKTDEELTSNPASFTLLAQSIKTIAAMVESTLDKSPRELLAVDRYDVRRAVLAEAPHAAEKKHGTNEIMDAINAGELHLPGRKKLDIGVISKWFSFPVFTKAVMENPLASKMAGMCIDAADDHIYKRSLGIEEVGRIFDHLTREEKLTVTAARRQYEAGKTIADMKLPDKIKAAVEDSIKLDESYRLRMQESMRETLLRDINQTELRIFSEVMTEGADAQEATKKWNSYARKQNKLRKTAIDNGDPAIPDRVGVTTYGTMKAIFEKYKEYESWGFNDYVTHAMRGDIIVTDEKGRIITAAQTTRQAANRAIEKLNEIRDQMGEEGVPTELFIDTDFRTDKEAPTLVSPKYYRVIQGRIAKAIKAEATEIQGQVDKAVADKVLRRAGISIKPKSIWTPFTEARRDILPGEEDVSEIYPLYIHMMEKKMAYDPYIAFYRKHITEIKGQPGIRNMLEDQLNDAKGRYWPMDKAADQVMEALGIKMAKTKTKLYGLLGKEVPEIPPEFTEIPFSATRVIRQARQLMAIAKLGYRIIAAIINLASGMGHAWIKTSAKYVLNAWKIMRTDEGKDFLKRYAPALATSLATTESGQVKSTIKWWSFLGMFQAPEYPNRATSFIATYLMSRDQGLNERAAVEAAKRGVWLQQFNYNMASIPKILRGPSGKLVGQFKTYLLGEMTFLSTLTAAEWVKYTAMYLALGGPRGLMITLKSLPPVLAVMGALSILRGDGKDWLDQVDEYINTHLPRPSRGIFGYFGIDASAPATFQFPQQWNEWAGVTVSEISNFAKMVLIPLQQGEKYINWKAWGKGIAPIARCYSDLIDSFYHDGWLWDNQGNKKYKVDSFEDRIKLAVGAKPLGLGIAELQNKMLADDQKTEHAQIKNILEHAVKQRYRLGDDGVVAQIAKDCMTYKVMPDTLTNAIEASEMDPLLKRTIRARLPQKIEVFQKMKDVMEAQESIK